MGVGFNLKAWVRHTFLGWLLGVVILLSLSSLLEAADVRPMQFPVGVGMAAGVALCQLPLTRAYLGVSYGWLWASILGMGLPFLAMDLWHPDAMPGKLMLTAGLGSAGLALLQHRLLGTRIRRTGLWLLGTSGGWVLSAAMVYATGLTMALRPPRQWVLLMALLNLLLILAGSLVLGLVTGYTIVQATTTPTERS
jgi:hypothetical protein